MSLKRPTRKLLVIPNDPLYRYTAKGEVKERYFNPEDFFDEVHVLSLAGEDDSAEAAKVMAGRASVKIYPVGRPGPLNWKVVRKRAVAVAKEIRPQLVRGYNPLFMGYLAVYLARAVDAKSVVSVHDDYSFLRSLRIYGAGFLATKRAAYQLIHSLLDLNRVSLGQADHVICAYRFPLRYVERWRKAEVSVIYNRVDLEKFAPAEKEQQPQPGPLRILNVGRQFEGKNPEPIIRAVAGMHDVRLTLVGDGPYHGRLIKLSRRLGLDEKIKFIPRIPHQELPEVYRTHHVFAMSITQPGVCIPVLEAAASGLPVVLNTSCWENEPEVVGNLAEVVPLSPQGFRRAFERLAKDPIYRKSRGNSLRKHVLALDGKLMEQAERELYEKLLDEKLSEEGN